MIERKILTFEELPIAWTIEEKIIERKTKRIIEKARPYQPWPCDPRDHEKNARFRAQEQREKREAEAKKNGKKISAKASEGSFSIWKNA